MEGVYLYMRLQPKGLVIVLELLTNEIYRFVQPRQNFLTEAIIHRYSQEVRLGDEVWLWAGIAGV